MEEFAFSKYHCNGCGKVFPIAYPVEICLVCNQFFCKSCVESGKYERHKEKCIRGGPPNR